MTSRLQDEIKQGKPFSSRATEAMLSILRTAAMLDHATADTLRPFGITPTQHNVLRILRGAGGGGLCGREVGERLVARVPDVPRLLDRMEAMDLVSRERDAADRRHVTARITPKGLQLLEQVTPELERFERSHLARLDERMLQDLVDGLAAIREAL